MRPLREIRGVQFLWLVCVGLTYSVRSQPAHQQYHGPDDLATSRSVMEETLQRLNEVEDPARGKLDSTAMLMGANSHTIAVADEETGDPVAEFVIHGVVLTRETEADYSNPELDPTRPVTSKTSVKELGIGRLESQKVSDPDGVCTYEGVGVCEVEFVVWAAGFLPEAHIVSFPSGDEPTVFLLKKGGVVRGRLVEADSGEPLRDFSVELYYPYENAAKHYQASYSGKTDPDGEFTISRLVPDTYRLAVPSVSGSIGHYMAEVRQNARRLNPAPQATPDSVRFEVVHKEELERPPLLPPTEVTVDLREVREQTLEPIRLERAGVLDLTLVNPQDIPLPNFPFEIETEGWRGGGGVEATFKYTTDAEGRARIPLGGIARGKSVAVYVPSRLPNLYRAKDALGRDPEDSVDEGSHFSAFMRQKRLKGNFPNRQADLSPDLKAEFNKKLEVFRQLARTKYAGHQDHPNAEAFLAEPGKNHVVRIVYRPQSDELDLAISFRDKATGQPISAVEGAIGDAGSPIYVYLLGGSFSRGLANIRRIASSENGLRVFRLEAPSGDGIISSYRISESLAGSEKRLAEARQKGERDFEAESNRSATYLNLHLVAHAEGYADQLFEIPLETARAGRKLVFELEPGATVRGRVLMAGSGKPLTLDEIKSALSQKGKWNEMSEREWKMLSASNEGKPSIQITNPSIENSRDPSRIKHFADAGRASIEADGHFQISGLKPGSGWSMAITAPMLPALNRPRLVLKRGENDFGNLLMGTGGRFRGSVVSKSGEPISKVLVRLTPGMVGGPDQLQRTDDAGTFDIDLTAVRGGDRQTVYLLPPWGYDPQKLAESMPSISFEQTRELRRTEISEMEASLDSGHMLHLKLPVTPPLIDLAEHYSKKGELGMQDLIDAREGGQFFAIRGAALQALAPDPHGLTYAQDMRIPNGGIRVEGESVALDIPNVPPGRFMARIDGGVFRDFPDKTRIPASAVGVPIAACELEMPDEDTTVTLEVSQSKIAIELEGLPQEMREQHEISILVSLERKEPPTTVVGSDMRRLLASAGGTEEREPESFVTPMIGFMDSFVRFDESSTPYRMKYRPITFYAVPPGAYMLRAYTNLYDLMGGNPKPYHETEVEVPMKEGSGPLTIPYREPVKQTERKPIVE